MITENTRQENNKKDTESYENNTKEGTFKENITMAILGPVSAGKSTFFNALMSNTYSDMKRKKTTMLPQLYKIDKNNNDSVEEIYNKNKESNEAILRLRESNEFDVNKHFTQLVYNISPIDDFIVMPDKRATYSILDMPGLNCGGDTLYYDYIKKISKEIDIYILVFDINSGLNTTDEVTILKLVTDEIIKNGNGHVRILINKCDDIHIKDDKVELGDDELNELYDRCLHTIKKHCEQIIDKVTISPLCSSKLYVYRGVKNNISTIDENQLNNLIKTECGKTELKKLDSIKKKRKFISGLLQKSKLSLFDDWMNDTGYSDFKKRLDEIILEYPSIVSYHINLDLDKLIVNNKSNFNYEELNKSVKNIVKRITRTHSLYNNTYNAIFDKYLKNTFNALNTLICSNMKNKILNLKARKDLKNETIDLNIEKIRISLQHTGAYFKILEKLDKIYKCDEISDLIKSLTNKKNELLVFKFKNNNFNPEIFGELQEFNLIDIDFFTSSVISTLKHDISYFEKIYCFLNEDSQDSYIFALLDNYIDIFIDNEEKCKIEDFDNFCNSVNVITKNKKINLLKKAMFIEKFIVETDLSRYLEYWITLNSQNIILSNQTKYIYYYLSKLTCKNIQEDDEECNNEHNTFPNYDNFNEMFEKLDTLFNVTIKNTRKDYSFLDKKINHKNSEKKMTVSNNESESEIDESDNESCNSDLTESTENYNDDDNSEIVYNKANENTKKRTKNIINMNA